jgi:hypothetical protein
MPSKKEETARLLQRKSVTTAADGQRRPEAAQTRRWAGTNPHTHTRECGLFFSLPLFLSSVFDQPWCWAVRMRWWTDEFFVPARSGMMMAVNERVTSCIGSAQQQQKSEHELRYTLYRHGHDNRCLQPVQLLRFSNDSILKRTETFCFFRLLLFCTCTALFTFVLVRLSLRCTCKYICWYFL